jgi:hypothetical protein
MEVFPQTADKEMRKGDVGANKVAQKCGGQTKLTH